MELDSLGRKIIVLDAYIKPFATIEKAKKALGKEITDRISHLQEIVEKGTEYYAALEAIENNNTAEYLNHICLIKEKYSLKEVLSLQKGITYAIERIAKAQQKEEMQQKEAEEAEEAKKQEQEADVKEKIAEDIKKEQPENIEEKTLKKDIISETKEKYQELIKKYKNQMYEIREKIESNKANEEERTAWFAYNITDLIVISKRSDAKKIIQEEASFLKKQLEKAMQKNQGRMILHVYQNELKEIGIDAVKLLKK